MRLSLLAIAAFVALGACSSSPNLPCPGCGITSVQLSYTGSFVSGSPAPPVDFTAIGQTATVTMQIVRGGKAMPLAAVSGMPIGACSAATIEPLPTSGQIHISSVAAGTCMFLLQSRGDSTSLQVNVP